MSHNVEKSNKKILILVSLPFYKSSGSPLAMFMKVKAFSELNYKMDVICYPHGENYDLEGLQIMRSPKRKVFKHYVPGQFRKKLVYDFFIFLKAVKQLYKKDYQFIIAAGTMIYFGRILKLFSKKKFIAIEYGNLKTELAKWNVTNNNIIGNLARSIEINTLNKYDLIFSEALKNISPLYNYGLKEEKVNVLRISAFSSPVLTKKVKTENFIVLYTGTFVKIQNLDLIYDTARLLLDENIEFRLIGGEEYQVEEEKAKTKGLTNVTFYSRLPQKEFEDFFSQADIVVSPRVFGEDCPQKIVNYLNFGKCILASDAELHHELLDRSNAYLSKPFPKDFAEAIKELQENVSLREALAKKGKQFFEGELSYDIMKKRLSNVLLENKL